MVTYNYGASAWNIIKNLASFTTDGTTTSTPLAGPTTPTAAAASVSQSLNYYVRFTLYDNSTVSVNGAQLFGLSSLSLQDLQTLNIGSQTGGAGAGKVTFSPVELQLTQTGLQSLLFQKEASGTAFKEVDILGYSTGSTPQLIDDYSLGLVGIDKLATDASGVTNLGLEFGSEAVQQYVQNPQTGAYAATTLNSWNTVQNLASFTTDGTTTSTPLAGPTTPTAAAASVSQSLNYYVRFTLYDNSTVSVNGAQLFGLSSLSLQDLQTLNIGSQTGGAGAGKVTFSPVELQLTQTGLQSLLFQKEASGTAFKEVDILGYSTGSTPQLVDDYSLGLVGIDKLATDASGVTNLGLEFGSEAVQQYVQNPQTGAYAATTLNSWNTVQNLASFTTDGTTTSTPLAGPTTPTAAAAPVSQSLNYYVRFTLYDNSTVSVNGAQLFGLSSLSLQDLQTLNIGSQTGGAGAGKVTFSPVELQLTQTGLQSLLFQKEASGTAFKEVDILGYSTGSTPQLVDDYSLGLVGIDKLATDASGVTNLGLEFGSEAVQQYVQNPQTGAYAATTLNSWNIIKNLASFTTDGTTTSTPLAGPTTPTAAAASVSQSLNYYVRFTLYDNSTVSVNGAQLFGLSSLSLQDLQTLNIGSQTVGAGAGKVTFSPVELQLTQTGLQSLLFQKEASGTAFKEVDILGYSTGSTPQLIDDYSLGLVGIDKLATDASGVTNLGLEFGSEAVQQYVQNPQTGAYAATTLNSWNTVQNLASFTTDGTTTSTPLAGPTTPTAAAAPVSQSLNYYVRFTLYDNSTVSVNGAQLFGLSSLSLQDLQTLNIGSQTGGAGAGKVTFSPVELQLTQTGLQSLLFQKEASGTAFKEVDILGYSTGSTPQLVDDYSLGLVGIDKLATDASGVTNLGLEFGSEAVQQYVQNPQTGAYAATTLNSWNTVQNLASFTTDGTTTSTPLAGPTTPTAAAASVSQSLNYYVRFTLYDNSTVSVNGAQLFGLSSLSLQDLQTLNIGSQTGGAGAGKVTFSPVELQLTQTGLQSLLFQKEASGTAFKEVDILGYSTGSTPQLVDDYSLGLVGIDKLATDAGGVTNLGLEFGSEEIQQYSGAVVSGGEALIVSSGQTSNGLIVDGTAGILNGGLVMNSVVSSGGKQTISSGGVALDLVVATGGEQDISAGGIASGTTVSGGAQVTFGAETNTVVETGLDFDYGAASGTVISGGLQIVEVGASASGTTVYAGGEEYVSSGGTALSNAIKGGVQLMYGTESGTIVSGGSDNDYGRAVGTVISIGGLQIVQSGATANGTTIKTGGYAVTSGTESGTALSGGSDYVYGTALGTTINNGLQIVSSGGSASGTTVNSGGEEFIASGAIANHTIVNNGAQVVSGRAVSTILVSGGIDFDYGLESGSLINGGVQIVEAGDQASGSTVNSGGEEYVASGGTGSRTTINSGAQVVFGTAISTIVNSGGLDFVFGVENAAIINNGGAQIVEVGVTVSGTVVNSGGEEYVASGGTARSVTITSGVEVMFGTDSGTTLNGGLDFDYGSSFGTTVISGVQVVETGALASGTIVKSGGEEYTASGGTIRNVAISGGFEVMFGTEVGTLISGGGSDLDYGKASGTILSNGLQIVEAGGSASGTVAYTGGQEYVVAGGTASGTTLSGGFDVVYGTTISTVAGINGVERVFAGGVASAATINSAGYQIISSGGTTIGTHINSGGQEIVASGGTTSASVISGGILELTSGASVGIGEITFDSGGTLRLDDSIHFGGLVAGFELPDGIDCVDIAYNAATTKISFQEDGTGIFGTLTVSNGANVGHIALLGQYVAGNFNIQTDGHGGTLVTDPPVSGASNALAAPH